MPSIQDIVKKNKTKMFKQANTRQLEEVLPINSEVISVIEPSVEEIKVEKKEFKKVPYRPWDDDEPSLSEGKGREHTSSKIEKLEKGKFFDDKITSQIPDNKTVTQSSQGELGINNPTRMIISLYGDQRNILKFLIQNISYEEEGHVYTFPIDLKSVVLFTSSSKHTVETSIR